MREGLRVKCGALDVAWSRLLCFVVKGFYVLREGEDCVLPRRMVSN